MELLVFAIAVFNYEWLWKDITRWSHASYQLACKIKAFKPEVLNLFCLVYPLPNENIITYPNFLMWAGASSNLTDFRFCDVQYFLKCSKVSPAKHRWCQKKRSSLKFQGFFRPKNDLQKKRSSSKFQVFFRPKTGDLFLGFENMAQRQSSATLSLFQY